MLIYLGNFTEVTQLRVKKNNITNKRQYFKKKRMLFIEDIASVQEDLIINRVGTDYNECSSINLNSGELIKVEETYEDLTTLILSYYQEKLKTENKEDASTKR